MYIPLIRYVYTFCLIRVHLSRGGMKEIRRKVSYGQSSFGISSGEWYPLCLIFKSEGYSFVTSLSK